MARRYRKLASGLATRVEHLEQRLRTEETWQEKQGRAWLTAWLANSEDGAERLLDFEDARDSAGSQQAMLATDEGRTAIEALVADLFTETP